MRELSKTQIAASLRLNRICKHPPQEVHFHFPFYLLLLRTKMERGLTMSTTSNPQSAAPIALGYYYQGLYALVVLCDGSDRASVSIETDDDVVLNDTVSQLYQLKHSMEEKGALSIVDLGLWKAMRNWSSRSHDGSEQFLFATRATVAANSPLAPLLTEGTDRAQLLTALVAEAQRVIDERAAEAKKSGPEAVLPHAKRVKGCEAFLALGLTRQQALLKHTKVITDQSDANSIPDLLSKRLGGFLLPAVRSQIIERLIQWWDREIVLSLLGRRQRGILKSELQIKLNGLVIEHGEENLPDDFSILSPGSADDGITRCMAKQIEWVEGGPSRLSRAALARWRARSQRDKWMSNDISISNDLNAYDTYLVESWKERFGPAVDDCISSDGEVRREVGRRILDWSHLEAAKDLRPIRTLWAHHYLVQGSYQQLAEDGRVGWHPDYEERYKALKK